MTLVITNFSFIVLINIILTNVINAINFSFKVIF